jgi:hypothetical protein
MRFSSKRVRLEPAPLAFPNGGGIAQMQNNKSNAKLKSAAAETLKAKQKEEWVKHEAKFAPKPNTTNKKAAN